MKLVIVRHLPTAWNAEDRLQGGRNIPILPLDAAARARLAKQVEQVRASGPYDVVYCSALDRTRETAGLFGFKNPIPDALLNEIDFGEFEGRLRGEMLAKVGKAWLDAPETLTFGEAVTNLGERAKAFVRKNLSHARVLAFGHGGWTRALSSIHRTGNISQMNRLTIANGEAISFEFETI